MPPPSKRCGLKAAVPLRDGAVPVLQRPAGGGAQVEGENGRVHVMQVLELSGE